MFQPVCVRILPGLLLIAASACGPSVGAGDDGGGGDDTVADAPIGGSPDAPTIITPDGAIFDATNPYGDADITNDGGCTTTSCPVPVPDGCGAVEVCDDGLDNNCNGAVDEGCVCVPGAVQPCFLGQPGRRNVGACVDGTQRCTGSSEFGTWGACTGGIWPSTEQCDTQDNNCNGCADDNPLCCVVELSCPGPGSLPEAAPFTNYVVDGSAFYTGTVTSWNWTVTGGPCDQLFLTTTGTPPHQSFTLTGATSPSLTFRPTLSGDYTFTVTMTLPDGTIYTCTFVVHVRGPGLRVELCWDTTGSADIDLHEHKAGTTSNWFEDAAANINSDDCYYYNCKGSSYNCWFPGFCDVAEWGYSNTALAECSGGPDGIDWTALGSCHNPRLDVDNISTVGIPENINVDNPRDGETFRTMVHYYGGSVVTHPLVNIYCGGNLVGTYGAAPDTLAGFSPGGGFNLGKMWRVVDVTTAVDATGTTTGCTLNALHPPAMVSGYWITNNVSTY